MAERQKESLAPISPSAFVVCGGPLAAREAEIKLTSRLAVGDAQHSKPPPGRSTIQRRLPGFLVLARFGS